MPLSPIESTLLSPLIAAARKKAIQRVGQIAGDLLETIQGPGPGEQELLSEAVAGAYIETVNKLITDYIEKSVRTFETESEKEARNELKECLEEFNHRDIKAVAASTMKLTNALTTGTQKEQISEELIALITTDIKCLSEDLKAEISEKINYRFDDIFGKELIESYEKARSTWLRYIILSLKSLALSVEEVADLANQIMSQLNSQQADSQLGQHRSVTRDTSRTKANDSLSEVNNMSMKQPDVPSLPNPYIAQTYNLQKCFSGRIAERQKLSEWLTKGEHSVFPIIRFGGMGKSALSWVWLHNDVLGNRIPDLVQTAEQAETCQIPEHERPEGVLWWTFYEDDAHFEVFLDRALAYASNGNINPHSILSPFDRVRSLVDQLRDKRLLLILDGFEFELKDYAGHNAAYMGEDVEVGKVKDSLACSSPYAADFLNRISSVPLKSRILITSRLLPKDLNNKAFCHEPEKLSRLSPEDALEFFKARGVQSRPVEIKRICEAEGYHPLSLQLLAGLIINDKESPGDIRVVDKHSPLELKRKKHNILDITYAELSDEAKDLLNKISIFRGSTTYKDLCIFNEYQEKGAFNALLDELVGRGFIFQSPNKERYDMHPVVRNFAYKQLDLESKKRASAQVADHTLGMTDIEPGELQSPGSLELTGLLTSDSGPKVERLADLERIINVYNYKVDAALYDEAFALYRNRLARPLYHRFAANDVIVALLTRLVTEADETLPLLGGREAKCWVLNELANAYSRLGESDRAVPLRKRLIDLLEQQNDKLELAIALKNLGHMDQVMLGEFRNAKNNIEKGVELLREVGDKFQEAVGHQELAHLLIFQGEYDQAELELSIALALFKGLGEERGALITYPYQAWRFLLMNDLPAAVEAAREALKRAEEYHSERNILRAKWVLGAALISLADSSSASGSKREDLLREAETLLNEALSQCSSNQADMEPDVLRNLARCYRAQGKMSQARQHAEESLSTAKRWGSRLKQAEANNVLGLLSLDAGDNDLALKYASDAKRLAKCVDSEECYRYEMLKAEQLLEKVKQ